MGTEKVLNLRLITLASVGSLALERRSGRMKISITVAAASANTSTGLEVRPYESW